MSWSFRQAEKEAYAGDIGNLYIGESVKKAVPTRKKPAKAVTPNIGEAIGGVISGGLKGFATGGVLGGVMGAIGGAVSGRWAGSIERAVPTKRRRFKISKGRRMRWDSKYAGYVPVRRGHRMTQVQRLKLIAQLSASGLGERAIGLVGL